MTIIEIETYLKRKTDTLNQKILDNLETYLKKYQKEIDIQKYSSEIRKLLNKLQAEYNYNELEAMLVLKDILAHEYLNEKNSTNYINLER